MKQNLSKFDMPIIVKMTKVDILDVTLGDYLKKLRGDKTLHEVTMGTDIQTSMLSRIESGERLPTVEQIKRLAKFYKIKKDFLITKRTVEKILEHHGANKSTFAAVKHLNKRLASVVTHTKRN